VSQRDEFRAFILVDCETETLPVGRVRELWHSDVLDEQDREIARAEELYREHIEKACRKVIELYRLREPGTSSSST
jgi:hypothetical protein